MNEPRRPDDGDDDIVDAAWRRASREEPPAQVDAAILAAARTETRRAATGPRAQPRRAWWSHWQPLAVAAGVAGVAFVLVHNVPRDEPVRSPATVERKATVERQATGETTADVASAPPAAQETAPEVPAPAPSRATAPDTAPQAVTPGASAERAESFDAAPQAAARAVATPPPPGEWARRIVALHAAGDLSAASAQLREFRRAYPDADRHLPDELQDWAAAQPAPDAP